MPRKYEKVVPTTAFANAGLVEDPFSSKVPVQPELQQILDQWDRHKSLPIRLHPKLSKDDALHLQSCMGNMLSQWVKFKKTGPSFDAYDAHQGALGIHTSQEEHGSSMLLLHEGCLSLLRAVCNKEYASDTELGRYLFLNYEQNGLLHGMRSRARGVDIERFWHIENREGGGTHGFSFAEVFEEEKASEWLFARPDRLPLLPRQVDPSRLPRKYKGVATTPFLRFVRESATEGQKSPLDLVASMLCLDDLLRFSAVCTSIRRRALLQWQPHFKRCVLKELSWAALGIEDGPARLISPSTCDWFTYVTRLFSPTYKRHYLARRRLVVLALRIKEVADKNAIEVKRGGGLKPSAQQLGSAYVNRQIRENPRAFFAQMAEQESGGIGADAWLEYGEKMAQQIEKGKKGS